MACMRKYVYFHMRAYHDVRLRKSVFAYKPLKKSYEIQIDFCRRNQLRSICKLMWVSSRKIVSIVVSLPVTYDPTA